MLGELLGEGSGKITAVRVLPTEGQQVKLEVSIQGSGKLLGVDTTDTSTYWQTVRPGGVLYGEGHWVAMTRDGDIADWIGFGVGKPTGPASAAHYGVCGSFQTASGKLAHLTSVATVMEYDTAEDGSYRYTLWEWK
jgi:hypothetical protein